MTETRTQFDDRSVACGRWLAVALLLVCARIAAAAEAAAAPSKRGIVAEPPAGVRSVKVDGGYMVPYTEKIPGTDVSFEMIPVPGGEFLLGSPPAKPIAPTTKARRFA